MKKLILLGVSLILTIACSNKKDRLVILSGNALGTTYSIRYLNNQNNSFTLKMDSLVKAVNKSVSTYIPSSDISKINAGDSTIVVDAIFEEVFFKSSRIYKETDGIFDPTVGVLVNAWGFGPGKELKDLDSLKIAGLMKFVGFDKVQLKNHKIIKQYPDIYFDFNAIAKGFLVDLVGRNLEKNAIHNYMVEIGGEIRARGKNEKNKLWRIAIEEPNFDGSRSFATTIQLHNESMATSGNYRKYRIDKNGNKYAHTINTKTGFATPSNLLSASVINSPDCADADGYATALMAMGFTKATQFLENHPELKAYLIYLNKEGEIQKFKSKNFNN